MANTQILCGSCKCAVQTVANPKANDQVSCPRCNRSDRFDKVMNTAKEHLLHHMQRSLHARSTKAANASKFVKITFQKPVNRSFRWVTSDKGI